MEYGVFTSNSLEIANTKFWTLCFYCNCDTTNICAELYNGINDDKTLAAICERNKAENKTVYAYETPDGKKHTNDFNGVCQKLGSSLRYDISAMIKKDNIELSEPYKMPTVADVGIEQCLKQWRMGTEYRLIYDGMMFQMVTDKIEYIFSIQNENCNIYCGASVNIPYDGGMFGSGQYFRFRNFGDNSKPFCRFHCDLGKEANVREVPKTVCESGKCTSTAQGLYWPVKRFDDNEIVLDGCGGAEYTYRNDSKKSEFFVFHNIK
jgi:hypothetical protein